MSLLEVKKQIIATQNTKKITKAMQLVAASKMKNFQVTSGAVRIYTRTLLETSLLAHVSVSDTEYAAERTEGYELFVILTSDKGLCGAMNNQLIRNLLRSPEWQSAEGNRRVITVGRKSADAAKREGMKVEASLQNLKEDMQPIDALVVVNEILTRWESGDAKKIHLVSPWYVNAFTFESHLHTYLPLTRQAIKNQITRDGSKLVSQPDEEKDTVLYEPGPEEVANTITLQVLKGLFLEAFYQLKATEYSSRMVAMKKATEAADEQIKLLTKAYNKARQAAITQQLAELASANEAMSNEHMYERVEI